MYVFIYHRREKLINEKFFIEYKWNKKIKRKS